ncbi:hypothetical protein [Lutibacter sp.]|uniref:hypothetical protein n=1 Tax=Lutibacter sp. TaxID=1925666 RepID=UPI0025BB2C39|nr:hypothetical protein [Lutibacter sp.]
MSKRLKASNYINSTRNPNREKTFINKINGQRFIINDVQIMKYKRNKLITSFLKKYISNSKYTMIEIGVDFNSTKHISNILFKLKRQLKKIGITVLGYVWLVDRGEYGGMHFHLVLAIEKINIKGKKLPKEFKLKFKGTRIHSAMVTNKPRLMNYLLKKEIYYIGKRKRVYGKSRKFL